MTESKPPRCNGCGKPLEEGDDTVRIALGKAKKKSFTETKEWGVMHRSCFNRSIDSPSATMDELKRQAREAGLTD